MIKYIVFLWLENIWSYMHLLNPKLDPKLLTRLLIFDVKAVEPKEFLWYNILEF